jgi:hypothetical protein
MHSRASKLRVSWLTFTYILVGFSSLFAQNKSLYRTDDQLVKRQANAIAFSKLQDSIHTKNQTKAKISGIRLVEDLGEGRKLTFQHFNEVGEAMYLTNHSNRFAGQMTRTDQLYQGGLLGLALTGGSDTLSGRLAIWDGGVPLITHQEFGGRITSQEGSISSDAHSTHVAGTLISAGINSTARGMAFGANLRAWDYSNDNAEISDASIRYNLLISNHSYGYQAGWVYDAVKLKWQWWGNDAISSFEDYKFGFYDSNAQALDKIAYNAPMYLITKSAGNSRNQNGPDANQYYLLKNTKDSSIITRAKNDSYDIISTTGTAKNILTVGAAELNTQIPMYGSEVQLSDFTSWGPTDDGRIKPDIVGIGTDILSTTNTGNTAYATLSGTSMASPQVAGSLLLIQQLYNRLNKGAFMRAASLKGLAIHTALDMGNAGPDYQSGWGLLNAEKAAQVIQNKDGSHRISEGTLANGAKQTFPLIASGKGGLEVTISWTDPEGNVLGTTAENLNNRSPRLVNDLDIQIQSPQDTFLPYILDPENPANPAKTGNNIRDNVEKIKIQGAIPGQTYTLILTHKGTLKYDKQDFSLIISGIGGPNYCPSIPTNPGNVILKSTFGTIEFSATNKSDFTQTRIQAEQGSQLPYMIDFANGQQKEVMLLADWNQDGDFDDLGETMKTTPANLSIRDNLTISPFAKAGNYYRLRLIASTNGTPSTCGNYASGDTKEFLLEITQASKDIAAISLNSSTGFNCATNASTTLQAKIKNAGSKAQTQIPIRVNVVLNQTVLGQLTGTIPNLAPGKETNVSVSGPVALLPGKNYQFILTTNLSGDQFADNNELTIQYQTENPSAPTGLGINCLGSNTLTLNATSGFPLWYANNTLIGSGLKISSIPGREYFIASNDFSGTLGPATKNAFGTGTYFDNFGPAPILDIKTPVILTSARVYVGTSGTITFSVTNKDTGELIYSIAKDLIATRTQSNSTKLNGQLTDDKNDPGQLVELNLPFPKPGNYLISQSCSNGASIFRSNRSLADTVNAPANLGYPYTIPYILSMTGSLFNGAPITTGYYYLYDMKFSSLGCPSARVSVPLTQLKSPIISLDQSGSKTICRGTSLLINAVSKDQADLIWQLNGASTGQTSASITATQNGIYQVSASFGGQCPTLSNAFTLNISTPLAPLVSFTNGYLKSTEGANMQWFLENTKIAGATEATFMPTQSGAYKIELTDINGCLAASDKIYVSILGQELENPWSSIIAYPNPAQASIQLGIPEKWKSISASIQLVDLVGKRWIEKPLSTEPIDLRMIPPGNYIIFFQGVSGQKPIKFTKF